MKRIVLLSMALIALVSCREENDGLPEITETGNVPVRFTYTVSGEEWLTRFTTTPIGGHFDVGDQVGIYMIPHQASGAPDLDQVYTDAANVPYQTDAANNLEPAGQDAIMYPWGNEKVNFVSYYPYQSAITNYKIPVDVKTATGMGLLYANGVGTALERGEPVTFNYTSQLCVLKIKVTSEDDYIDLNLADPQLTLSMPVTANFDLSEGRHTDYQTGPLELDAVQSSATEASWKTFVIPHAEYSQWETDRTFTFTFGQTPNEQTHTFYLPVDFKFIAGHNYELEFEVKKPSLALPDDGKANCFMVEPGERFTFKTARAYEEEGVSNTTLRTGGDYANGKFEAAVLWDDADVIRGVIVKGAGPATEVTIITDTEKKPSGNAAVKVYKKNDPEKLPVWSYHIWVTDYEPVVGVNTWTNPYNTSFTFMDRNLGATACNYLLNSVATYGLLYQWGRKDPFPGSAPGSAGWDVLHRFEGLGGAGTIPANNNDEAIKESIRHPERFYLRNTTNNNWLPAIDNKLWNPTDGTKSVYDPCPSGWCVPKQKNNLESSSPWYGYASTSNEAKWGSWVIYDYYRGMVLITESYIPAYYPASGYRNGNGNAGGAGSEGCLYVGTETSTDINDIGVLRLYYNASGTFVFSTDGATTSRSNGYSVRCVKYS